MSQRSCERVFKVSNKTVAKLFEEAGDMAIMHVASLRDLTPKRIQADELHAFVAAKDKNIDRLFEPDEDAGTVWGYLAMCADTKLIFSYHLGERGLPDATAFARDIYRKLKRTERNEFTGRDEFAVRPLIVTDGLPSYKEAFEVVFGDEADRAAMVKKYADTDREGRPIKKKRYAGADREVRVGQPNESDIHTSYIERQNLNLRMGNRRYNRKTNAFSKTPINHERHLALWIMYHNLCWVPCPGRPRDGSRQWVKRLPAAIAAGITDKLWEIEDLLALTDEFTSQRKARQQTPPIQFVGPVITQTFETKPTHWVFRHFLQRTTKIHKADCTNCRDGRGKTDGAKVTGEWLPFRSLETAKQAAETLEPDRNSICKMCIGEYQTLGYRHAGSSRQSPS
ncbi:hypothetical protein OK349_13160 [Sphingomonas sp. BT-65]|uniref:hypothetical protein n=1 Tax=Sphingomonas sp. BT-65 TaxID=2989821 RepID=UPI0022369F40|nr:hypothetical protein [Sphingomonas sp. BT-65]MCW4462660.1 hypothetical protein [Sphingomonas sp. BT-65]